MKNQGRVIIGFFLVLIIVLFSVMNNNNVPVSFGFISFSAPLILVIIGSALLGALIVFLSVSAGLWQQKKEIKALTREIGEYKEQLDKKTSEVKEAQQQTFRNQQTELDNVYQTELQEKNNSKALSK